MEHYPDWLIRPIHFPFPFPPLPSIAAAFVAAALSAALLCWGMFLIAKRWPFKLLEPAGKAGSPIWLTLAVLLSLAAGIGTWKLVYPGDLATACAWNLACVILIAFRSRPRRSTQSHLRTGTPNGATGEK